MNIKAFTRQNYPIALVGLALLAGLYLSSLYNYVLFHSVAELFSISIGVSVFFIAWNSRRFLNNNYLLFIGIVLLYTGGLDLIHTLAYKGINIFAEYGDGLSVQIWVGARYIESLSLVIAPLFLGRKMKTPWVFMTYGAAVILLLLSIFYWRNFPVCYIDGVGLTLFKQISEYIISLVLAISIILLYKKRAEFDRIVFQLLVAAIAATIAQELILTSYTDVYGLANTFGHFLKIAAFYLVYKAVIQTGLSKPFSLLLRKLKQSEESSTRSLEKLAVINKQLGEQTAALEKAHDELEQKVQERTAELSQSEEKFSKAFFASPNLMAITTRDEDRIIEINDAFCHVLGYTREECLGRTTTELNIWAEPDQRNKVVNEIKEKGYYHNFEADLRNKTGKIITVLDSIDSIMLADRKCFISVLIDITERKKAEQALKESEHLFSTMVNSTTALIWMCGQDKLCTWFNEPWFNFTGRTLEQELGAGWAEGVHPEDLQHCIDSYYKAFDARQPFTLEYRLRYKDGSYRWVIDQGVPRYDAGGMFVGYIGFAMDITYRKKIEEALNDEITRRRLLVDQSGDGMVVLDQNGKVYESNRKFAQMIGYSPAEVSRLSVFDWECRTTADETREMIRTDDEFGRHFETKHRRKDGTIYDVEITTNAAMFGGKKLIFCVCRDITDHKIAENKLRSNSIYTRGLIEASLDPLVTINAEGKITDVNKATEDITGYGREVLIGTDFSDYFTELHKARAVYQQVLLRGYVRNYPLSLRHKTGKITEVSYNAAVYKNESGEIQGIFAAARDMTEHKIIEAKTLETEALKRVNQAKSELLSNVSHELRTPLTTIKGFIETLLQPDVKWSEKEQMEFLNLADSEADRLLFLIRDLLDMSRIDSGKMVLDKRSYSIEEILESVRSVISVISSRHKLEIKLQPNLPKIQVDKLRIGQVITNLVENAAKFSPEETLIIIKIQTENHSIIFSVEDQGPGMSEDVMGKLFDRFYQAQRVISGKTRGTGLGLAICKGIVEAHGGKIWVTSQPCKGSIFSFSIPI